MQRIRGYYRGLVPEAEDFFDAPETDAQNESAIATVGLRPGPVQLLFTGATMVAAINSIIGGVGLALLAAQYGRTSDEAAVVVGLVVAVGAFVLHMLYEQRRSPLVVRPLPGSS